jgi:hypothetical protein
VFVAICIVVIGLQRGEQNREVSGVFPDADRLCRWDTSIAGATCSMDNARKLKLSLRDRVPA